MPSTFYIDKTSNTSSDTLQASGFVVLLTKVLDRLGLAYRHLFLTDEGPDYKITLPFDLTPEMVRGITPFTLVQPLLTEKELAKREGSSGINDGFDYPGAQARNSEYYEKRKKLDAKYRRPGAWLDQELRQILESLSPPSPAFSHYQAIQQMKVAPSFNDLALRWIALEHLQGEHILLLMRLFEKPQNDVEQAVAEWKQWKTTYTLGGNAKVTQLQIINPIASKGSIRAKGDRIEEGNPDNFWLLELLKFAGFMEVAAPFVVQGGKDRKCYILQPKHVNYRTLSAIMQDFRAVCWSSTAVKLDIMASLRFTQVFLNRRKEELTQLKADAYTEREDDLVQMAHGFESISYKDMGSAFATMNVSNLNLPQWIRAEDQQQTRATLDLVEEHLALIQNIASRKGEEGAEEYELLRQYRDFISGRDLRPFWHFTLSYSSYLISRREGDQQQARFIRPLSVQGLETIIRMHATQHNQDLNPIIEDLGFQNIAYAIRQATVNAQYRRSQKGDRTYDVRYGLGQELMREARYKHKFIVTLAQFLHEYDAETAREEEKLANRLKRPITSEDRKKYGLRMSVSKEAIQSVAKLIDRFGPHGSEVVGSLLVAYGYASDYPLSEKYASKNASTEAARKGNNGSVAASDQGASSTSSVEEENFQFEVVNPTFTE